MSDTDNDAFKLGDKLPDAIELMTGAAAPILNRW